MRKQRLRSRATPSGKYPAREMQIPTQNIVDPIGRIIRVILFARQLSQLSPGLDSDHSVHCFANTQP